MIIGPGSKSLNASFARDVRFTGNRSVSINVNASNLLNLVQYGGINTNVNSPNFGQITSVRPMRSIYAEPELPATEKSQHEDCEEDEGCEEVPAS